jgi:hypothetical protein
MIAQTFENIAPDLSSSDLNKYKQDLSQASDSGEACATRYRMAKGIPYDVAVISFVDFNQYCGGPETALETLCTIHSAKEVNWLAFGLLDVGFKRSLCELTRLFITFLIRKPNKLR